MSAANANTKTVLITGATRGIGLKLAERYGQLGWKVIGAARDLSKAEQLKALSPYKLVQLDASDEESILRAAKDLDGEPIDLLINNAGIAISAGLEESTKADILKQVEVNAVGPFLVTRAFLPSLKAAVAARGAATVAQMTSLLGSITVISSDAPELAYFNNYGYRTSKAALNMLNASLAKDIKSDGITAIVIHPGLVATDMTGHMEQGISADASADGLIATLSKLTIADTGKFYVYDGTDGSW